jgi:hypothetical protein
VSAAAAPLVNAASGQMFGGYLASAVFGGLASVAGGGKFENGAITGAFGYLFTPGGAAPTQQSEDPGAGYAMDAGAATAAAGAGGGGIWDGLLARVNRIFGIFSLVLTLSGDTPRYRDLYRAVDPTELAYLLANGNYGFNPGGVEGKYFALTYAGVVNFVNVNTAIDLTITYTTVPVSVFNSGYLFPDPGAAGPSIFFSNAQLPKVYSMTCSP